ncbi:hypothetical protein ACIBEJ_34420 [Nonomuraea sp. NPDC050790]|uniref:hypothetical protein n=1 Tax=Nonomuraea sp. NPDC050790 TaxID=3364371 RepID=UPI003787D7A5
MDQIAVDENTYPTALDALAAVTRTLLQLADSIDIDQMQALCRRYETLAPLLDPTAYMRGGRDNLATQGAFLSALQRFVADVRKLDQREANRT